MSVFGRVAACVVISWLAFSNIALSQSLPPGARIVGPEETVALEHVDRFNRLKRLSKIASARTPFFSETIIRKEEHRIPTLPVDIPVLRVIFDVEVFFDTAQHDIRPEAFNILRIVSESLRLDPPDVALFVAGHADSRGTNDYNYALALRRARAVSRQLSLFNPASSNIFRVSFGESVPIAKNSTARGMARNRRVEFLFAAHPKAVAEYLAKQRAPLCEFGNRKIDSQCRFRVELTPPKRIVQLPKPDPPKVRIDQPKAKIGLEQPRNEVRFPPVQDKVQAPELPRASVNVDKEAKIGIDLDGQPKSKIEFKKFEKYEIDLQQKKVRIVF